jgi:hypothetical protein
MRGVGSDGVLEAALAGARLHPEVWYLRKWGVLRDPDLRDDAILKRMWKLWPGLSA